MSDEGQIAFGKYVRRNPWDIRLVVQNADGSNKRTVLRDDTGVIGGFALSPDGLWLARAAGSGVFVRRVDEPGWGEPVTLPAGVHPTATAISWSSDGTRLAFTADGADFENVVLVADVATLEATVVVENFSGSAVHWSPDGEWLAYTQVSSTVGCRYGDETVFYSELMKMRSDGTGVTPLTDDRPWDWRIVDWGERGILGLTYKTGDSGDTGVPCDDTPLYRSNVLDPDRGRNIRLRHSADARPQALSPDGTSYLLAEWTWPGRIWRVDLEGGERALLTRHGQGADWVGAPES